MGTGELDLLKAIRANSSGVQNIATGTRCSDRKRNRVKCLGNTRDVERLFVDVAERARQKSTIVERVVLTFCNIVSSCNTQRS